MNFVFLMDPLEMVKPEKDTSLAFMIGAHRRGHKVFYLPDGGISLKNNKVHFRLTPVIPHVDNHSPFHIRECVELSQDDVHAVFVRSDPPFDQQYLMNTWLLDRLPKRIPVINNPAGLRTVNEKIWAAQFHRIVPKTVISRHKNHLIQFLNQEKTIVVKPANGFGGSSVFVIRKGNLNTNVILETVSRNETEEVIAQTYVADAKKGDKRILLLNGEPLGAVLRVHAKDDHRNNFFAGGKPHAATITANDRKIIKTLKPHLKTLGLYFVGIDIIGKYLMEVNVTSPTCLQEMNRLNNVRLEDNVIDFVEKLVKNKGIV